MQTHLSLKWGGCAPVETHWPSGRQKYPQTHEGLKRKERQGLPRVREGGGGVEVRATCHNSQGTKRQSFFSALCRFSVDFQTQAGAGNFYN